MGKKSYSKKYLLIRIRVLYKQMGKTQTQSETLAVVNICICGKRRIKKGTKTRFTIKAGSAKNFLI